MRIKNWEKFQHFKDRRPPWIKLYRNILDDPDWHAIDAESAKVLVMLWLVASEDETQTGQLPDLRKLAFRMRMKEKDVEKACSNLSHWLEQDDIKLISGRYQSDAPETETETETEVVSPLISGLDIQAWDRWLDYRKKIRKPIKQVSMPAAQKELAGFGPDQAAVVEQSIAAGWQGLFQLKQKQQPAEPASVFRGMI